MTPEPGSILLVLLVPFRKDATGRLLFEKQACNGLGRWAENFRRVVVASPLEPPDLVARRSDTIEYVPVDPLPYRDRLDFIPLPWAFTLLPFLKSYRSTRALLAQQIQRCEFLSLAIGALVGDWGTVAAREAIRQNRPFSVWTDRVEHRVILESYVEQRGLKRIYRFLKDRYLVSPLMRRSERQIISRAALGLFHGRDCFDAYSPFSPNPQLVHDIHLKPHDRIDPPRLHAKLDRIRAGELLRLLYVGRVAAMKGPHDWLQIMEQLHARNIPFTASWLGDGPLLEEMRAAAAHRNLADKVLFQGFVGDRAAVLDAMRNADLFIFCHKTPESPRCLIEALLSAAPIVGYRSSYSQDLTGPLADRLLTPLDDTAAVADRIATLNQDRALLAQLTQSCYELSAEFSDEAVFKHRSDLIKQFLGSDPAHRSHHSATVPAPS